MKVLIALSLILASTLVISAPPVPNYQTFSTTEMARYYKSKIDSRERENLEELHKYQEREQLNRIEQKLNDIESEQLWGINTE
jgi:RNA polymerase-binding transcription factor DksA